MKYAIDMLQKKVCLEIIPDMLTDKNVVACAVSLFVGMEKVVLVADLH